MKSPEMGMGVPKEKTPEEKEKILGSNLVVLCDNFITYDKNGEFSAMQQEYVDSILSIINEHYDKQNRNIEQPYAFLRKLREAEESALSKTQDNSKRAEIKELFKHVDMPGLELPEKE